MTEISKSEADARVAAKTAPKIDRRDVEAAIASTEYIVRGTMTLCIATMQNGYVLTGKSGAASAENFDEAVARHLAFEDVIKQAWPLMGYALRERLRLEETAATIKVDPVEVEGMKATWKTVNGGVLEAGGPPGVLQAFRQWLDALTAAGMPLPHSVVFERGGALRVSTRMAAENEGGQTFLAASDDDGARWFDVNFRDLSVSVADVQGLETKLSIVLRDTLRSEIAYQRQPMGMLAGLTPEAPVSDSEHAGRVAATFAESALARSLIEGRMYSDTSSQPHG